MPKRKYGDSGAPSRKSARLEQTMQQLDTSAPAPEQEVSQDIKSRVLPSPSASGSVGRDNCPIDPGEGSTEAPLNDSDPQGVGTKSPSHSAEPISGAQRRAEESPQSKQSRQTEAAAPPSGAHVSESSVKSQKELDVLEQTEKDQILDPISYWAKYQTWPDHFLRAALMTSLGPSAKRQRSCSYPSGPAESRQSYAQSRKEGLVPEAYSPAYEDHILAFGLDMDLIRGEDFVSERSKELCNNLLEITCRNIQSTTFAKEDIRKFLNGLATRNEAIVNRDVTTMICPSLTALYFSGSTHLEHLIDEVNADWHTQCYIEGPRLRPDLAIGLFASVFTEAEILKLKVYKSADNWAEFTKQMYFPFLMGEVKCGRESLNVADRQNMHSCSVAVKALLRIEQEADKYRSEKTFPSLLGQILVYSMSHDHRNVRLYGHFAVLREERLTYHRYCIRILDIFTAPEDLLIAYNFVQNVLKLLASDHVERLKCALSVLPEPSTDPIPASSDSFYHGPQNNVGQIDANGTRNDPVQRDADGFELPRLPDVALNRKIAEIEERHAQLLNEQIAQRNEERQEGRERTQKLERQMEEQRKVIEEQRKEMNEREERRERQIEEQRKKMEEKEEQRERQMEEQRKKMEEKEEQRERQMEEQRKELMSLLMASKK